MRESQRRGGVQYCMLPLDEKYLFSLSLCIFLGARETGWFEVSETREGDISNIGTVPALLVPKPYPITP